MPSGEGLDRDAPEMAEIMPGPTTQSAPSREAGGAELSHEWEGSAPDSSTDGAKRKAWEQLARCRTRRDAKAAELKRVTEEMTAENERTVRIASECRDRGMGAQEIADALGISRAFLYQLAARCKKSNDKKEGSK